MVASAVAQWVGAPVATTVTGAGGDTPELSAPANTVPPSTSGSTVAGGIRNGAIGTWTGNPEPTFAYQWQRDEGGGSWVDMEGQNSLDWLINDVGDFRLEVTATNSQGITTAYSASFVTTQILNGTVGSTATDGAGNWGFQIDRAMGNTFTLSNDATLKMGHLYIIPESGSGSGALKLCVYTNNAGAAGNFICESNQIVISEAGWANFPFNDDIVPAQDIHIIAVTGETSGAGWDMGSFNSGGQPAACIYTTFDYNNPPSPAPAPDNQYANGLAINIDYEYTS